MGETTMSKTIDEALILVRTMLVEQIGDPDYPIDASLVPPELQEFVPLASQFGIGDDGAREVALDMMPIDFVADAARRVSEKQKLIHAWAAEGEWTDEKNAFVALMQGLLPRVHVNRAHPNAVPPEAVAAVEDLLRDDKEF
jgi:hypothetical protein